MARGYTLTQTGTEVQADLDRIEGIGLATRLKEGLMSASDKEKLDSLGVYYGTTEYWDNERNFIPKAGEIVIYSDYYTEVVDGVTKTYPAIKIGSGNGYIQDLAFVGEEDTDRLIGHISDALIHVTAQDRAFWNNKLNVTDAREVVEETLILNRN